jgi:membrane protein involved in colicin uptake
MVPEDNGADTQGTDAQGTDTQGQADDAGLKPSADGTYTAEQVQRIREAEAARLTKKAEAERAATEARIRAEIEAAAAEERRQADLTEAQKEREARERAEAELAAERAKAEAAQRQAEIAGHVAANAADMDVAWRGLLSQRLAGVEQEQWAEITEQTRAEYQGARAQTGGVSIGSGVKQPVGGTPAGGLTEAQIDAMTPDEINANWDKVQETLKRQGR